MISQIPPFRTKVAQVSTQTNNVPNLSTVKAQHETDHAPDPKFLPDLANPEKFENSVGRENDQHALPENLMDQNISSENYEGKLSKLKDFNLILHPSIDSFCLLIIMFNLTPLFAAQESLVCFDGDAAQSEIDISTSLAESVSKAETPGGSNTPFDRDSLGKKLLTGRPKT